MSAGGERESARRPGDNELRGRRSARGAMHGVRGRGIKSARGRWGRECEGARGRCAEGATQCEGAMG